MSFIIPAYLLTAFEQFWSESVFVLVYGISYLKIGYELLISDIGLITLIYLEGDFFI